MRPWSELNEAFLAMRTSTTGGNSAVVQKREPFRSRSFVRDATRNNHDKLKATCTKRIVQSGDTKLARTLRDVGEQRTNVRDIARL